MCCLIDLLVIGWEGNDQTDASYDERVIVPLSDENRFTRLEPSLCADQIDRNWLALIVVLGRHHASKVARRVEEKPVDEDVVKKRVSVRNHFVEQRIHSARNDRRDESFPS